MSEEVTRTSKERFPLTCEIVDGVLRISVSAEVVKHATEQHPDFYNVDNDVYMIRVQDQDEWLRSVVQAINHEGELGDTLLTDMFDKAIYNAVDQGYEGLSE